MLYKKHALLLFCLLASSAWAKKKKAEGDGAIRIVVRGPPLPILLQNLSGFLMNQYIRSFSGPGPAGYMQSRSDYPNPFNNGGYNGHPSGPYNNYYSPKRTGYHFGHGLDVLSKLIFGSNPATFTKNYEYGTAANQGTTYLPKFNIHNGLTILKGLLRGSQNSRLSELQVGRKQGTVKN